MGKFAHGTLRRMDNETRGQAARKGAEPEMMERIDGYSPLTGNPLSLFQRMQIGLLMLLVTSCGALAAGVWQSVNRFADKEIAQDRELQLFHANLVAEMRRLSENAGVLTSADLCPVRFRIRQNDKWGLPARPIMAILMPVDAPDHTIPLETGPDGVLNFGLVPPGRYRLALKNQSGYGLEHEFEVLPGVPIDRLVFCPLSDDLPHLITHIDAEHVVSVMGRGLTALFYVERDDVTVGEWTWRPTDRQGVWVSPAVHPAVAEEGAHALEVALSTDVVPDVTFLHCRCIAMAALQTQDGERRTPRLLGTFRFQIDAAEDDGDLPWPGPVYDIDAPAARYRRSVHAREATWSIELPLTATRQIERRLEGFLDRSQGNGLPAASNPPAWGTGVALIPLSVVAVDHRPSRCQVIAASDSVHTKSGFRDVHRSHNVDGKDGHL